MDGSLFLEAADLGHQRLDIVVGKAFGGLHLRFVAVLDAFLDRFGGLVVGEGGLVFGIGHVLGFQLLAHFRVALAVGAVAFLAALLPNGAGGGQGRRARREGENCQIEFRSFHNF